jgi:superfamily II DNA/RNA helicase
LGDATEVQLASRAALLNGDDVIINAETGCGKTLAFLAPLVNALYCDQLGGDGRGGGEGEGEEDGWLAATPSATPSAPPGPLALPGTDDALFDTPPPSTPTTTPAVVRRGLVLAPTLELAIQIRTVFDKLVEPLGVHGTLVHKREMIQVGP